MGNKTSFDNENFRMVYQVHYCLLISCSTALFDLIVIQRLRLPTKNIGNGRRLCFGLFRFKNGTLKREQRNMTNLPVYICKIV